MLGPSTLAAVLQQPPLATLLQQAALLALAVDARASCSAPLLAHPLTRQRALWLWRALELVSPAPLREHVAAVIGAGQPGSSAALLQRLQVCPAAAPAGLLVGRTACCCLPPAVPSLPLCAAGHRGELACVSLLWFSQLVVVALLPTLAAGLASARSAAEQQQPDGQRQRQRQHLLDRAARAAGTAWANADAQLAGLCRGGALDRLHLALVWYGLLSMLWMLAQAAALRSMPVAAAAAASTVAGRVGAC